jgi:hypothetical protein
MISVTDRKTLPRASNASEALACFESDAVHMRPLKGGIMIEVRELIDAELDSVSGGVSDLGKYITKAVDDALSAAIGGNTPPGNGPGVYPQPAYSPKSAL